MFIIENFLPVDLISKLKDVIDTEIANNVCTSSSLYQSYNYMHLTHTDVLLPLLDLTKITATKLVGKDIFIKNCWFNVCKHDSVFDYHTHQSKLTAVYFLKGCNGNGTLFKINNVELQLKATDNSLLLFEPSIAHTVPPWDGEDRYSIAIDFEV